MSILYIIKFCILLVRTNNYKQFYLFWNQFRFLTVWGRPGEFFLYLNYKINEWQFLIWICFYITHPRNGKFCFPNDLLLLINIWWAILQCWNAWFKGGELYMFIVENYEMFSRYFARCAVHLMSPLQVYIEFSTWNNQLLIVP